MCLLMTGCAQTPPEAALPSTSTSAAGTPTPSVTPTPAPKLIVSLDGITRVSAGDESLTVSFHDGAAVVALVAQVTGTQPEQTEAPSIAGYDLDLALYNWDGLRVTLSPENRARIAITAAQVAGVTVETEAGVSVGSSRAEVIAAQGWNEWDADGDGIYEVMAVGSREVAGTKSLVHPGSVGVEYFMLIMDGDVVGQIQVPGDDFSDL